MPKGHNPNPPLDRDALHRYLWGKADTAGRLVLHQIELASKLDITRGTMHRIVKEFVEQGRLTFVESLPRNVKVYKVSNPKQWAEGQKGSEPRQIRWG